MGVSVNSVSRSIDIGYENKTYTTRQTAAKALQIRYLSDHREASDRDLVKVLCEGVAEAR
jgi:hypothetical protein